MKRKKAGILVVLMFVFTAFFAVYASAEETTVTTAADFATAITNGGTINVGADFEVTEDVAYTIANNVTLNLNGHTITFSSDTLSNVLFTVNGSRTLEVTDSTSEKNGKLHITSNTVSQDVIKGGGSGSTFTLTAGTIKVDKLTVSATHVVRFSKGTVNLKGGTLKAGIGHKDAAVVRVGNDYGILNMTAGEVIAESIANVNVAAIRIQTENSDCTFTGGKITVNNNHSGNAYGLYSPTYTKKVNLNGVEITVTGGENSGDVYGYWHANGTTEEKYVIIEGATKITVTGPKNAECVHTGYASTRVAIKGNAILTATSTGTGNAYAVNIDKGTLNSVEGTPTITASNTGTGNACALYVSTGTVKSISGGTFEGKTYGINNAGTITEISGGTIKGGEYGIYNTGTVTTFGTDSSDSLKCSGTTAGAYIVSGTVGSIGKITIADSTPWGVLYSESSSTVPEKSAVTGISGATNSAGDANYKGIGIRPVVSGTNFFANGYDITISAREGNPEKGCIITYTDEIFGEKTIDTGDSNWNIFAGGYGKITGQDADTVGVTVETTACAANKTPNTITVTMTGGVVTSLNGGGYGNTHVKSKVVMNLNGGTANAFRGGGNFNYAAWGKADWGKGWAIVDDVEMNVNGQIQSKWSFDLGGYGSFWVENAVLNLNSSFSDYQNQITVAGENDYNASSPIVTAYTGFGFNRDEKQSISQVVSQIKTSSFDSTSQTLKPNMDGLGSAVVKAVVNCNAETKLSVHGGNYGGHYNSYTGDLTVNINQGGKIAVSVGDTYGHVENTTVNVESGGTLTYLTQCNMGSSKDLTLNVKDGGTLSSSGYVQLGRLPNDNSCAENFIGGLTGWDIRFNYGGLTSDATVRINNQNDALDLKVYLSGGVVSKDIVCTGNVNLLGGNSQYMAYTNWSFIRSGAKYKTTNFSWNRDTYPIDFGQRGYLLVTNDLHNISTKATNFILGNDGDNDGVGDGKMYVYQGQYSETELDANSTLKTKYEVDGTTVVLGDVGAENTSSKLNGVTVAAWKSAPTPKTISTSNGNYVFLDENGAVISSDWEIKVVKGTTFEPDPEQYKSPSALAISPTDTLRYTITRNNVTLFGKTNITVESHTITYDLNGITDPTFATTSQTVIGKQGSVQITKPNYTDDSKFFLDWNTKADGTGTTYLPGDAITLTEDVILYAQWENTSTVEVVVGDEEKVPVKDAKVSMQIGGKNIREPVTTDENGYATLTRLPYGAYNLVVETTDENGKTIITTLAVDVHEQSLNVTVVVHSKRLNTVVSGSSHVAVDQIENAISQEEQNSITTDGTAGSTVAIRLQVNAVPEDDQKIQNAMNSAVEDDQTLVEYVDVTVQKVTTTLQPNDGDGNLTEVESQAENIKETDGHLTITFHISDDVLNAISNVNGTIDNIFVYHRHVDESGKVTIQQLRKVSEKVGQTANYECFYIREIKDARYITVRANRFSTYAFGVQESEVSEYKPSTGGSGGYVEEETEPDTGVSNWLNTYAHNQYLAGYPDSTFRPNNNMTRAEVAQMFYNLLILKHVPITATFSDVPENAWYATAVNTLASIGMIEGVGDGRFQPNRTITRAEFTKLAMKFAIMPEGGENIFSDVKSTAWYYNYIVGATQYSWISGYPDGTFRPQNPITRAEVTSIVNSMLGRSADVDFITEHESELKKFTDLTATHWAYAHIVEATNSHDYEKDDGENWLKLK